MGSKHGRFEMVYPSGDRYRGDFRSGQRHGKGVYESARGDRYEGMWVDDMRHGYGLFTFTKMDAKGAKWAGSYEGDWVRDLKHGKGVFSYPNGDKYDGQWMKGKKTGLGCYFYANGDKYIGEFMNDDMHGQGMMLFANGDRLSGHWEHDLLNGEATFTDSSTLRQFKQQFDKGERTKEDFIGVAEQLPPEPTFVSAAKPAALKSETVSAPSATVSAVPNGQPNRQSVSAPTRPAQFATVETNGSALESKAKKSSASPLPSDEVDDLIAEVKQQQLQRKEKPAESLQQTDHLQGPSSSSHSSNEEKQKTEHSQQNGTSHTRTEAADDYSTMNDDHSTASSTKPLPSQQPDNSVVSNVDEFAAATIESPREQLSS